MRIIALLPLCLLLGACQTTGPLDENSPFHVLPSGSRLILKQELTIPAHNAGVSLQGGRVVNGKGLNQYHPHCRLEVHDVRETTQIVTVDEFVVHRSRQETQTVARAGMRKVAGRSVGSGPAFIVFRTVLDLRSERQPQVRWLTCQQWSDPALGQHVTIREMRATLGEIITLQLPSSAANGNR
jgi:hypothetical protein